MAGEAGGALSQGTVPERQPRLPALAAPLRGGRRPGGCRSLVRADPFGPPALPVEQEELARQQEQANGVPMSELEDEPTIAALTSTNPAAMSTIWPPVQLSPLNVLRMRCC